MRLPRCAPPAVLAAALMLCGCSPEALKRGSYESLHTVSDLENADDPRYERAPRPGYETYRQQREELLRGQRPEEGLPAPPAAPAPPAGR